MQIIELMDIFKQLNHKHNGVCKLTYVERPMLVPDMAIHLLFREIRINQIMCDILSTPSKAVFALAHEFGHFINRDDRRVHRIGQLECEKQADLYARAVLIDMNLEINEAINFIRDLSLFCPSPQRPSHPEYQERIDALWFGRFKEEYSNHANY